MRAAIYDTFSEPIEVRDVPDPIASPDAVILRVEATGICRSDWHGWRGDDPDIRLPHVPGHELAGLIEEVGGDVRGWRVGQRVTVPFVCGCGRCPPCGTGNQQICDRQEQPGFTGWGSFADLVAVRYASDNLVALPETVDSITAASLGCRFTTSWRAVVEQGRTGAGEWVAVHGCGGVGLSAVMIAKAAGAHVIAVDVAAEALALAEELGADVILDARATEDVVSAVVDASLGGAHVSLDALGSTETCDQSIRCLRKQGRHVQVGLMVRDEAAHPVPMDLVIARELELRGSHGMAAHGFRPLLEMIERGRLDPRRLVTRVVGLEEGIATLMGLGDRSPAGVTVIDMQREG